MCTYFLHNNRKYSPFKSYICVLTSNKNGRAIHAYRQRTRDTFTRQPTHTQPPHPPHIYVDDITVATYAIEMQFKHDQPRDCNILLHSTYVKYVCDGYQNSQIGIAVYTYIYKHAQRKK